MHTGIRVLTFSATHNESHCHYHKIKKNVIFWRLAYPVHSQKNKKAILAYTHSHFLKIKNQEWSFNAFYLAPKRVVTTIENESARRFHDGTRVCIRSSTRYFQKQDLLVQKPSYNCIIVNFKQQGAGRQIEICFRR
jgi:hypothetical protein